MDAPGLPTMIISSGSGQLRRLGSAPTQWHLGRRTYKQPARNLWRECALAATWSQVVHGDQDPSRTVRHNSLNKLKSNHPLCEERGARSYKSIEVLHFDRRARILIDQCMVESRNGSRVVH